MELLPCPFCGSPGELTNLEPFIAWSASCSNNDCLFYPWEQFTSEKEAVEAWNTRSCSP